MADIKKRVRSRISGTAVRPRLSVHISNRRISAQLIDDVDRKTIASAQLTGPKIANAETVGKKIAELAKAKKVTSVVFDRGRRRYHGRVAALAKGAREGGLKF